MKTLILGAGFGTRLRPLTLKTPKPLLPIFGVPMIDWIIDHLKNERLKDIVINNHHLGHKIREYLGDGSKYGVNIIHSSENKILGSGGAIGKAAKFLDGEGHFLLHNGDIFTDIDITAIISTHKNLANDITMVLINREEYNQVLVNSKGQVLDIQRKIPEINKKSYEYLTYTGMSIINTALLSEFPDDREEDLINIYLNLIQKGKKIGFHFVENCFWEDMGNLDSYFQLHGTLHKKGFSSFLSPTARVAPSVTLKGFYAVGNGAIIGKNVLVENAIISDCSVAKPSSVISNSIYFEDRIIYSHDLVSE